MPGENDTVPPPGSKELDQALVELADQPMTRKSRIWEIKADVWTRYSWDVMLAAAPVSLELLATCLMLAKAADSEQIKLQQPAGKAFAYLKGYTYLSSSLVEVSNVGRRAFSTARHNMQEIALQAESTKTSILEIFGYMQDPMVEPELYQIQLENLEGCATVCKENAAAMHADFNNWLEFVKELHEACEETSGHTEAQFRTFASKEEAAKALQAEQVKQETTATETMKKFLDQLDSQQKQFTDLINKFPTGETLLKQQLAMTAADTVSNIVTIGVTAAAASLSPMAAMALAGKGVADATKLLDPSGTGQDGKEVSVDDVINKNKTGQFDLTDPALAHVEFVKMALTNLKAIVTGGPNDGVDWDFLVSGSSTETTKDEHAASRDQPADKPAEDAAKQPETTGGQAGTNGEEAPKPKTDEVTTNGTEPTASPHRHSLESVAIMMKSTKDGIEKDKDEKESKAGKKILSNLVLALKVEAEIKAELVKAANLNWKRPANDSPAVKEWKSTVDKALLAITKLSSQSTSRPGATSGRTAVIIPPDPAAKEKVKAKSDLNRDTIEAAVNQLTITQKALMNTQDVYLRSSDKVLEVQEKLGTLRTELTMLSKQKIALSNVRDVLRNCIAFLTDLQSKIDELVKFFSTIAVVVKAAVERYVGPYAQTVKVAMNSVQNGKLISQSLCDTINQLTIAITAYFDLYKDVAQMYVVIHDRHLSPGLSLVDEMSNAGKGEGDTAEKQAKLAEYARTAQDGIRDQVKRTGDKIMAGVNTRVEKLKAILDAAEVGRPLPPAVREAITDGSELSKAEMTEAVDNQAKGVAYISLPKDERIQQAAAMARAINPADDWTLTE